MMRKTPGTTSIRWNEQDLRLIEQLKRKKGITKTSELAREGLRALAEKEGLTLSRGTKS